MPPRRAYSDDEIEAAVQVLSDPERIRRAEQVGLRRAPQLQRILDLALQDADW